MKHILGVTYGGGHSQVLLPVLDKLSKAGLRVTCLALTSAWSEVQNRNYATKGYHSFITHFDQPDKILNRGESLLKSIEQNKSLPISESIVYLGANYTELELKYGTKKTIELYKKLGRAAFLPLMTTKRILEVEEPDLVITTNAPRTERCILYNATKLGIHSIRIEDLFGIPSFYVQAKQKIEQSLYQETIGSFFDTPTLICTNSEFTKENLLHHQKIWQLEKLTRNHIKVTGSPLFDVLDNYKKNQGKQNHTNNSVLWIYEEKLEDSMSVHNMLYSFFRLHPKYTLTIKLRPDSSIDPKKQFYDLYSIKNFNIRIIKSEYKSHELVRVNTTTLAQSSTVLLECAYLKKRAIILDPHKIRKYHPLILNHSATLSTNIEELEEQIQSKHLSQENSLKFVSHGTSHITNAALKFL